MKYVIHIKQEVRRFIRREELERRFVDFVDAQFHFDSVLLALSVKMNPFGSCSPLPHPALHFQRLCPTNSRQQTNLSTPNFCKPYFHRRSANSYARPPTSSPNISPDSGNFWSRNWPFVLAKCTRLRRPNSIGFNACLRVQSQRIFHQTIVDFLYRDCRQK